MNDLDFPSPLPSPLLAARAALGLAAACVAFAATGCGQHIRLGELPSSGGGRDGSAVVDAGATADSAEAGDRAPPASDGGGPDAIDGLDGASTVLWKATFEPGDLSEWTSDGAGDAIFENIGTGPAVTTVVAHRGRYAAKATVMPGMVG